MRIYLSSYLAGDRISELRALERGRGAVVLNALDGFGDSRLRDLAREVALLEGLGYDVEELDLRRYFAEPARMRDVLARLDLVWVVGGNAFVLGRAIAASGFADHVRRRGALGPFIYAGYSAGACVAGPDLAGLELVDDASVQGAGHPAGLDPATLQLVPFRVVPHWQSKHPESPLMQAVVDLLRDRALDYRLLRDGDSVLLDLDLQPGGPSAGTGPTER